MCGFYQKKEHRVLSVNCGRGRRSVRKKIYSEEGGAKPPRPAPPFGGSPCEGEITLNNTILRPNESGCQGPGAFTAFSTAFIPPITTSNCCLTVSVMSALNAGLP